MTDLFVALGLVFVLEGALYALFPGAMQRFMREALTLPHATLRTMGLVVAFVGAFIVWLMRS